MGGGGYDIGLSMASSSGATQNSPIYFSGGGSAPKPASLAMWGIIAAAGILIAMILKS